VYLYIFFDPIVPKNNLELFINSQSFYCRIYPQGISQIMDKDGVLLGRLGNSVTGVESEIKYYLSELQTLFNWMKLYDAEFPGPSNLPVYKLKNMRYFKTLIGDIVITKLPYDMPYEYRPMG
jgi:hypothetical protein